MDNYNSGNGEGRFSRRDFLRGGIALGGALVVTACSSNDWRSREEKGFEHVDIGQVYAETRAGQKIRYLDVVTGFEEALSTIRPNPLSINLGNVSGLGKTLLQTYDRDILLGSDGKPNGMFGDGTLDRAELNAAYVGLSVQALTGKDIAFVGYNPRVSGLLLPARVQTGVLNAFYDLDSADSGVKAVINEIQTAVEAAANQGGSGDNNAANNSNTSSSSSTSSGDED